MPISRCHRSLLSSKLKSPATGLPLSAKRGPWLIADCREPNLQAVPTRIKLAGDNNTLTIQWSDGHRSAYPYRHLRDKCPCATCEELGPPPEKPANPFPILGQKPLKPDRAELVGRYALQIFWNDGHSSGIYAFDYLRSLCPCPECSAEREQATKPD